MACLIETSARLRRAVYSPTFRLDASFINARGAHSAMWQSAATAQWERDLQLAMIGSLETSRTRLPLSKVADGWVNALRTRRFNRLCCCRSVGHRGDEGRAKILYVLKKMKVGQGSHRKSKAD